MYVTWSSCLGDLLCTPCLAGAGDHAGFILYNTSFEQGSAAFAGGGLHCEYSLSLKPSKKICVCNNSAASFAGGLNSFAASVITLDGYLLSSNTAGFHAGGALAVFGLLHFSNGIIINNRYLKAPKLLKGIAQPGISFMMPSLAICLLVPVGPNCPAAQVNCGKL